MPFQTKLTSVWRTSTSIQFGMELTKLAEYFVVIGTSLLVYPAASLLDYKEKSVPWFVIDRKTPELHTFNNLTINEEKASIGIKTLIKHLSQLI